MDLGLNCIATYQEDYMPSGMADDLLASLLDDDDLTTPQVIKAGGQTFYLDFGKTVYLAPELFASGQFCAAEAQHQKPWSSKLTALAEKLSSDIGQSFPVCVAIYYPDGMTDMDYHRDPPAFGDTSYIASISLGAEREFALRETATGDILKKRLAHGSMIYMGPGCQDNYEHAILQDAACTTPRINLTFRLFGDAV